VGSGKKKEDQGKKKAAVERRRRMEGEYLREFAPSGSISGNTARIKTARKKSPKRRLQRERTHKESISVSVPSVKRGFARRESEPVRVVEGERDWVYGFQLIQSRSFNFSRN